ARSFWIWRAPSTTGRADSEGARNGICLFIIHGISGICPSVLLPLRYVVGVSLDVVFPDYEI
ncbi:hypothetical protein, partial [Flavonifractor plautii]|uniref:hypothetical protein n=1 Tax=Flavonifractor plautii TaxID=292800 RepID=UPI001A9A933C